MYLRYSIRLLSGPLIFGIFFCLCIKWMYFFPVVKHHAGHHTSNGMNLRTTCNVNVDIIFSLLENYIRHGLDNWKKSKPVGICNLSLDSLLLQFLLNLFTILDRLVIRNIIMCNQPNLVCLLTSCRNYYPVYLKTDGGYMDAEVYNVLHNGIYSIHTMAMIFNNFGHYNVV